ncbi:MAG: 2-phospho-L-lactate transferase [Sandaracinaceae bacterium]|jgi:LPPG:FO 2-phospho-L-lactate transferase|nr:2-phospho-L-lactate transferase [Sandaracinaceae bacterium]MBP7685533.1 2-phospho-L-lactate transferase [Deltaproteobacteria bacterium]
MSAFRHVVALAGGVGGSRLAQGLARALPGDALTVVVNTGDDLVHVGLTVCPDLDTLMYTLGGLGDRERGWGLQDESFRAMEMLGRYGGPTWFSLGDRDLGTHLARTMQLAAGATLTQVTASLCASVGVTTRLLPMTDGVRKTIIETTEGERLPFQDWLVGRRAVPRVRSVTREGDGVATPEVLSALEQADLVVLCPSNPYVSIDPILELPGVRERVGQKRVVALSPIVGGKAVKGPLGTMIPDLAGVPASATAIVAHYGGLLSALVVEHGDAADVPLPCFETRTVMGDEHDRERLARELLTFAAALP